MGRLGLCVAVAVAILCLVFVETADAKRCSMRTKNEIWKHGQGKFVNEPAGTDKWVEYNREGKVAARFTVVQQHGNQVVLRDAKRNLNILLQDELCATNADGGSQYQQLYQGEWLKVIDCT